MRIQSEQVFHDQQARERARFFAHHPEQLCFSDDDYLNHEPWIRPAFQQLGDVTHRQVLDLGCGHGMASVVLARRGAEVTALELSREYLREARQRAGANEVEITFLQGNGERLPFVDATFDCIWGHAILHHLDLTRAGHEIRRVLKPGGKAIFCEPWGGNPLLRWARRRLPYRGKGHTPDEMPLCQRDVTLLRSIIPHVTVRGYQFLSMPQRAIPLGPIGPWLSSCDSLLLKCVPILQRFCRYAVLTLSK